MAGHTVSEVVIPICQKLVKRGCHFQLVAAFGVELLRPFGEYLIRRAPGVLFQLMINLEQALSAGEYVLDSPCQGTVL